MPADGSASNVVRLRDYRAGLEATDKPARLPLAIQAAPEAVALVLPEHELWMTPEQAHEVGLDLLLAAREAKGAGRG